MKSIKEELVKQQGTKTSAIAKMKTVIFLLFMSSTAQFLLTGSALQLQCDGNVTNEEVPPYSHSRIFGDIATPNDVKAFKYYCTNVLINSLIKKERKENKFEVNNRA